MRNRSNDLSMLKWSDLKKSLQEYFRPADFYRRAQDEIVYTKKTGQVVAYIDKMKCIAQKLPNVWMMNSLTNLSGG